MRVSFQLLMSILILLLFFASGFAQDSPGELVDGQTIYKKHCLRCHGTNGEGNGPDASTLMVPPANFQSPKLRMKSEFELRSVIVWGVAFSPMHGWFDKLTTPEMRAVVQYIRQMAPFQARSY